MPFFNIRDLIIKKRDGKPLNKDEIQYFVDCVSKNNIEECQLGEYTIRVLSQQNNLFRSDFMITPVG